MKWKAVGVLCIQCCRKIHRSRQTRAEEHRRCFILFFSFSMSLSGNISICCFHCSICYCIEWVLQNEYFPKCGMRDVTEVINIGFVGCTISTSNSLLRAHKKERKKESDSNRSRVERKGNHYAVFLGKAWKIFRKPCGQYSVALRETQTLSNQKVHMDYLCISKIN